MSSDSTHNTEYSPERRLEILESEGVITTEDDGQLHLTIEFEKTRGIYHDSYMDTDEETYLQAVGDVFGLAPEQAAERITELGVTREQFVALLSLNSYLEGDYPLAERANMAMMIVELTPESAVPWQLDALTDESYEQTLTAQSQAVVTVWKRFCTPCLKLKDQLPALRCAVPDAAALFGVDGETAPEFVTQYDVEAAPFVLLFDDGEVVETLRGYQSPETIEERCQAVFS